MHQGKELKLAVDRSEKTATAIAGEIGVSRDTLYQLFKKPTLKPYYVDKLQSIGILITSAYNTSSYTKKVFKGDENHTGKYLPSNRYPIVNGKALTMATMISMSIADLMVLQKAQEDVETVKAIQEVITHKQTLEALQRENSLLKEIIEIQKDSLKSHKRKR